MNRKQILVAAFSVADFAAGGNPTNHPSTAENSGPADPAVQLDELKKEARETAQAAKDYTYAQRAAFAEKMRGDITALNREMDEIAAKIETTNATTREEAKAKLQ